MADLWGDFTLPKLKQQGSDKSKARWGGEGYTFKLEWPETEDNYIERFFPDFKNITFCMPGFDYARVERLRDIAESLYKDPIIRASFETAQRDKIFGTLNVGAVRAYFSILGEYANKDGIDFSWGLYDKFAGIVWWTGRTGGGCIEKNAGVERGWYLKPGEKLSWKEYLIHKFPNIEREINRDTRTIKLVNSTS